MSEHMVCSMQTMHLSSIKISTISKQTKLSFHLSPFTKEYHWVCPKWFLSLWCIRHKQCTYLALKLTLSPNKRCKIPYDARHLVVPSGESKLISEHMVCSMQAMHLSCIIFSTISKETEPSFHLSLFSLEYQ